MHSKDKKNKVVLELQISLRSRHGVGWAQAGAALRGHEDFNATPRSLLDTTQSVPAGEELEVLVEY